MLPLPSSEPIQRWALTALNTNAPPFNNPKARQAIYYATDSEAIRSKLFQNRYPSTQGFTAPGGLFFSADVPGYRTYDLAKAKALVKELGGLKTQLGTINVLVAKQTTQALASQWAQAGIKTDIKSYDLGPLIQAFQSKKWTAMLQTAGSYDPAAGVGVAFRYASQSPFSGVKDKKLDALLGQAAGTLDQGQRKSLYDQAAKYMNDEAYSPFLFAFAPASDGTALMITLLSCHDAFSYGAPDPPDSGRTLSGDG